MIYVYTKKIENGFSIVFETNMYTDKNKIETYLDDDEHFWLILSRNGKINYGTCDECGEENIKISDHKRSYDFIVKKRYVRVNKNENIKWGEQYENIKKAIENEKKYYYHWWMWCWKILYD